jgi:hypothetical protein
MRIEMSTGDFSKPLLLRRMFFPFRGVHACVRGGVLIRARGAKGKQWKGAEHWGVNTPHRRAEVEDQVGSGVTQVVQVHSRQRKRDSLICPRRITRSLMIVRNGALTPIAFLQSFPRASFRTDMYGEAEI